MPHLSINIPSTVSSGSIFSELLRMAKCCLRTKNFIPRASDLFSRMIVQDGNRANGVRSMPIHIPVSYLKTAFHCYANVFQKFCKTHEEINISIMKNN